MSKIFLWSGLFVAVCFLAGCRSSLPENPPATVDAVNLNDYTGLWYEIARLPVAFQRTKELATAEYTLAADGSISLVNTAIRPDGSTRSVTGTAVPVEGSGNTKLKVYIDNIFARIFGSPPEYGNYWILKREPDYSLALVGSPNRETLWLLAREPEISESLLEHYLAHAREAGFAVETMLIHNGQFPAAARPPQS